MIIETECHMLVTCVIFKKSQKGMRFQYSSLLFGCQIHDMALIFFQSGPFLDGRTPTGVLPYTCGFLFPAASPDALTTLYCIRGSGLAGGDGKTGRICFSIVFHSLWILFSFIFSWSHSLFSPCHAPFLFLDATLHFFCSFCRKVI